MSETYKPGDGAAAFHEAAQEESRRLQKEQAAAEKAADEPANEGIFVRGDAERAEEVTLKDIEKESRDADR